MRSPWPGKPSRTPGTRLCRNNWPSKFVSMKNTSRKRLDRPLRQTNRHVPEQVEFDSKLSKIAIGGVSMQKKRIGH
jgi:hypothetical protein